MASSPDAPASHLGKRTREGEHPLATRRRRNNPSDAQSYDSTHTLGPFLDPTDAREDQTWLANGMQNQLRDPDDDGLRVAQPQHPDAPQSQAAPQAPRMRPPPQALTYTAPGNQQSGPQAPPRSGAAPMQYGQQEMRQASGSYGASNGLQQMGVGFSGHLGNGAPTVGQIIPRQLQQHGRAPPAGCTTPFAQMASRQVQHGHVQGVVPLVQQQQDGAHMQENMLRDGQQEQAPPAGYRLPTALTRGFDLYDGDLEQQLLQLSPENPEPYLAQMSQQPRRAPEPQTAQCARGYAQQGQAQGPSARMAPMAGGMQPQQQHRQHSQAPQSFQTVAAVAQDWLNAAMMDLDARPAAPIAPTIPIKWVTHPPMDRVALYVPRNAWNIRCIPPIERHGFYEELRAYGYMMRDAGPGSENYLRAFEVVQERSWEYALKEHRFYEQVTGERLNAIAMRQAILSRENDLRVAPVSARPNTASSSTQASRNSPDSRGGSTPETALTVDSDGDVGRSLQVKPQEANARPAGGKKRSLEAFQEEAKARAPEKARVEDDLLGENRAEILQWCKNNNMERLEVWRKIQEWKWGTGREAKPLPRAAPRLQPAPASSANMDSPAEILEIRRQWGILKPGDRTHPKDKEDVPDYAEEDAIENVKLRDDGQYRCLHEITGHLTDAPCCREGLNERKKRNSIQKSLRKQRAKTEMKILQNKLHPAHKCWNGWSSEAVENYTALHRARIDSILTPVQNVQHRAPAPTQQVAAPAPALAPSQQVATQVVPAQQQQPVQPPQVVAAQHMQQQQRSLKLGLAPAATQQGQQQQPHQQASNVGQGSRLARPAAPQGFHGRPGAVPQGQEPAQQQQLPQTANNSHIGTIGGDLGLPQQPEQQAPAPAHAAHQGQGRAPMTEGELRSMAHILLGKEETRNRAIRPPVVVWGIDLSKEPIGWKDEEVLQKVIVALREHGPLPRPRRRVPVPTAVPVAAVRVPTAASAPEVDRTPEETLEAENEPSADEPQVEEPESPAEEMQDDDSLFGDGPEKDATPSAEEPTPQVPEQPRKDKKPKILCRRKKLRYRVSAMMEDRLDPSEYA